MKRLHGYKRQKGRCFYCAEMLTKDSVTKDHFYPRSLCDKGKAGLGGNKVLACKECNFEKGVRLPTRKEISRYQKFYGRKPKNIDMGFSG